MVGLATWSPDGKRLVCYGADYTMVGNQPAFSLRTAVGEVQPLFHSGNLEIKGREGDLIVWEPGAARPLFRFPSGHQVYALDWSADGTRVASAGRDGTVKVWDAAKGKELTSFAHLAPAYGVCWSPDGRRLVVHSARQPGNVADGSTGTVTVWDVSSGRKVFSTPALVQNSYQSPLPPFPFKGMSSVTRPGGMQNPWSPDGKRLIVLRVIKNQDRAVVVDPDTGTDVAPLSLSLEWRKGGRYLVEGADKTARVMDWTTLEEVCTIPVGLPWTLSPDGKRLLSWVPLANRSIGLMTVWNVATGQKICTISPGKEPEDRKVGEPRFGADSTRLFAGDNVGRLVAWDAVSGRELGRFKVETDYGLPTEGHSPDGLRAAVAGKDGVIRLWDLTTGTELGAFRSGQGVRRGTSLVQWSPDSRWLLYTDWDNHTLKVWDAASEQEAKPIYSNMRLTDIAWAPDSRRLVGVGQGIGNPDPKGLKLAKLTVWDTATGESLRTLGADLQTSGVAWSPDGKQLATIGADLGDKPALPDTVDLWGTIKIWDANTGKLLRAWRAHSVGFRLAWGPDGKRLASIGSGRFNEKRQPIGAIFSLPEFKDPSGGAKDSHEIKVWDAETGKELCQHSEPRGFSNYFAVAWSPDGHHLLASLGQTTRVLDAATGKVVGSSNLEVFALSPDGRQLALADKDIRIHAFSPEGPLIRTLAGHPERTYAVAWSPDGRRLASSGYEGSVKLWDVVTGFELLNLPLGTFCQIAWSPDGRRLALSGTPQGYFRGGHLTTRMLILDPDQPPSWQPSRARTCHQLARELSVAAEAHLHDPAQALPLAQEAVRLAPEMGNYWNTLGMAQYRAGKWQDAVAAIYKALELREGGGMDWLFLAMSHQQLANKVEARKWYDQAALWIEKHQPKNAEMLRVRAEAAQLLDLEKSGE
jgi:WD40 repeat protein